MNPYAMPLPYYGGLGSNPSSYMQAAPYNPNSPSRTTTPALGGSKERRSGAPCINVPRISALFGGTGEPHDPRFGRGRWRS
jgi:hypothetical protein